MTESQNKQIRQHLEKGLLITPLSALAKFNCFRLASRINDLRNEGMKIQTEIVYRNENGKRVKKYAQYKLKK
jgi:hypothetical protein